MVIDQLNWIEISRSKLIQNTKYFKQKIGSNTRLMAMVKANAYGHGLKLISPILSKQADWFGVNTLEEALSLRQDNIKKPILICAPVLTQYIPIVINDNISICCPSLQYLNQIKKFPLKIHLKINTGMNRLGIDPTQLTHALSIINSSNLHLEGVYTHFHTPGSDINLFESLCNMVKKSNPNTICHCANTQTTIRYPKSRMDMVRIGIGIYTLDPVLSWKCKIVQIRNLSKNSGIGYDHTYICKSKHTMAIIPVGYSDGLNRHLSNHRPFLGRIAMNLTAIENNHLKVSDNFEILGATFPAKKMAKISGTVDYEILARLNPLIPRYLVA